jgi:hypothetical protein
MARPEPTPQQRPLLWGSLLALGAGLAVFLALDRRPKPAAVPPPGRNVLARGAGERTLDPQLLSAVTWNDVGATAEGVNADRALREEVIQATDTNRHAPAVYLRGLLLLANTNLESALGTFLRIAPAEIPASHLYAPYRLHSTLRPSATNPFAAGLHQAVQEARVPPLIAARTFVADGRLAEALKAYLRTDPADWTALDVRALRGLRLHAAFANDTAAMLQAALKAGRVPEELRAEVVAAVKAPADPATLDDLRQQFLQRLKADPDLQRAAVTGAVRQLEVRQQFAGRKYRELLDGKSVDNPLELPDETVLMLTLAAAKVRDEPAFERWSQELTRRYPTAEIRQWLNQLRPRSQ